MREKDTKKLKEQTNRGKKAFEIYYKSLRHEKQNPIALIKSINKIIKNADWENIDINSSAGQVLIKHREVMENADSGIN